MKIPLEWLLEYVETDASAEEIGQTLTMLGIELEGIEISPSGEVLDVKVTPNRGDCLSVLGIARELAAKNCGVFKPTQLMLDAVRGWRKEDEGRPSPAQVEILEPELCPRYAARVFENVRVTSSSEKIQKRLHASGMRPINNIVDITNYVMLELGQPLHAFDMDCLEEHRIVVRCAKPGEKIVTLDGVERELKEDMLMICDAKRPVAIAGVMGGQDSEVSEKTKRVLLESAHFNPRSIRRTRKALGLSTEASYRFERFVDPEGVVRALNRFADLLERECGITPVEGVTDVYPRKPSAKKLFVRPDRWNTLLGMEIPVAGAASILNSLGCRVEERERKLEVTPPSWREDLNIEDDLVEEIGRIYGFENIPEKLPAGSTPQGGEVELGSFLTMARNAMLRLGFVEIVTHTFRPPSPLDPECKSIHVRNPVSPELSLLRPSLLAGLAEVATRNRLKTMRFFEIGRIFQNDSEFPALAMMLSGNLLEEHWQRKESPPIDFFTSKGMIEELCKILHRPISFEASQDKRLHPYRQASLMSASRRIGIFGQLLPRLAEEMNLPDETFVAEFDLLALSKVPESKPIYRPFSPFPAVRRDIAMSISKEIPYSEVEARLREGAGEVLEKIWLFDVYEGPGIEEGHHSLAFALVLRHPSRTLTDEEANEIRERAFRNVEVLGAKRR
ncbi:MAG TPA: phenylalanine--tRNA ligase subunit beta [Fimbriimonadales bacterium]|nr:phenylalanine--tRNA ligase subunit beta [Fimbriimonadales bacterium]